MCVCVCEGRIYDFCMGGSPHYGERGSVSLFGGLRAVPPLESRGKAPGEGLGGGRSPPKVDAYSYWNKPRL